MAHAEPRLNVVAGICEDAASVLAVEQAVFHRLLYKFKNAHRRTIYYRKLMHVRKYLSLVDLSSMIAPMKVAAGEAQSIRDNESFALHLKRIRQHLDQGLMVILDCSWHLFHLLKQTFFMTMALVFVAILSRIFVVFRKLRHSLTEISSLMGLDIHGHDGSNVDQSSISRRPSGAVKMIAAPNSPEHSDSDAADPSLTGDPMSEERTLFSEELLTTIAALEQQCVSADDIDEIEFIETNGRQKKEVEEQTTVLPAIPPNSSAVILEKETPTVQRSVQDIRPKRKSSHKGKRKKRRRDEMDDIFGSLD